MMPPASTWSAFLGATIVMLVIPGPSVVYVMTRSLEQGRRAGLWSMLGLETGAVLHVLAAAGGLAAVLASSDLAYTVVRWGGAAYLVHLGVQQLRTRLAERGDGGGCPALSRLRLYRDGVLVDLLNPKTALFFLAFLPQFVDPARGRVPVQILVLGVCFVLLAVVCDSSYAMLAGRLSGPLRRSARGRLRLDRATGGVYLALAALAVVV